MLECMLPFFMVFEGRRPQARELTIIAVLCALGVAGRAAPSYAAPVQARHGPDHHRRSGLRRRDGLSGGGHDHAGQQCPLFSQGPWTPFQMFSMGIIGFLAGVLFRKGWPRRSRGALAMFGGIVTFVIYGAIMNPVSALIYGAEMNWQTLPRTISPASHGLCSRLRHGDLPAVIGGAYAGKAGPHQGQIRAGGVIQRLMDTHRKAGASVTDAPSPSARRPQDPHEVHVNYST